jgi:hypothetical protein
VNIADPPGTSGEIELDVEIDEFGKVSTIAVKKKMGARDR